MLKKGADAFVNQFRKRFPFITELRKTKHFQSFEIGDVCNIVIHTNEGISIYVNSPFLQGGKFSYCKNVRIVWDSYRKRNVRVTFGADLKFRQKGAELSSVIYRKWKEQNNV